MKRFKINIAAIVLGLATISFAGCKKFLDINENPNLPIEADPALLLPSAQAAIANALGNELQIYGGYWAQYWTQSPSASQYISLDRYSVNASSFDRIWRMMYSDALQDLQVIQQKNQAEPQYSQYSAIAYILKAYEFQLLADAFGNVPLTEAAQTGNTNPHYDTQEQVYDSIINYLDKGLAQIDPNADIIPGSEDLIFAGDLEQWRRFANTLKLRTYLRLSQVAPEKAEAGIQAMQTANATFLETDAAIQYSQVGGNQNPLFSEILGLGRTQNIVASKTVVDNMNRNNDPRASLFYEPIEGQIIGLAQGAFDTITTALPYSIPTAIVGAKGLDDKSALAPVKFISAAESYFLQAEAAARGWWTGGNARSLFESGIAASFDSYSIGSQSAAYIASAADAQWPAGETPQLKAIITQKYYAMCGNQSFEAWTEWRRTGYPDFFQLSLATTLGGNLYPLRLLYPNTELNQNGNFPGLELVTTPVWWDK